MVEITQSDELNLELNNGESTPSPNKFIYLPKTLFGGEKPFVRQERLGELWDCFEPDCGQELPEFLTSLCWVGLQDLINVGIN